MEPKTQLPWHWGEDWEEYSALYEEHLEGFEEDFTPDKYMDMRLLGPWNEIVLPLRIDHHDWLWDCKEDGTPPEKQDRDYIEHACNTHPALVHIVEKLLIGIASKVSYDSPICQQAKALLEMERHV